MIVTTPRVDGIPPPGRRGRWHGSVPGRWRLVGTLVALALLTLVVGWPLFELAAAALGQGFSAVPAALGRAGGASAVLNTLWTAALVTPLAVAAATVAALITERSAAPARRGLRAGMLTTLLVPPFVGAESWAQAYGPAGLTDDLFGFALPGTFGPVGVVLVLTVSAVPLAYLVVAAGLASRVEPDLERAARASGASRRDALTSVTLPLLRPALVGAAALVFVVSVNAFGVPAVLGLPGGFVTVTTQIYRDLALSADPAAFTRVLILASTLVVVALLAVGLGDLFGGMRPPASRTGAAAGGQRPRGRRSWGLALGLWAVLGLTTAVPLVAPALRALTRAVGLAPVPANWTLDNFAAALRGPTSQALTNSLVLAFGAATAVVVLGGLLVTLRGTRAGRGLGTVALLTFAVPGSALAVAVLLAHGPWLRDTLLLILVAYVAKFWALGHRTIAGSAEGLPRETMWAARASGAGAATTLRTVVVPLLAPALAAAWLLVFLTGLHELTMSSLLYGPGTETLAVAILDAQQLGDATVTAALAVLLTLLVVVLACPLLLVSRWWRRRGGGA